MAKPRASSGPFLSGQALLAIRALHDRQRLAWEQLGALDLERAKLEAQAAPIRQRLLDMMVECDALTVEAGKEQGVDLTQPGWKLDYATGALTR